MASTACFLHHHALTTSATRSSSSSQRQVGNIKPTNQLVCRAQKQAVQDEDGNAVSRRLALTVLIGSAALGSKVSPADAAYGESGISIFLYQIFSGLNTFAFVVLSSLCHSKLGFVSSFPFTIL